MKNIKELRLATGMSQQKFAEYLKIPVRTIVNWELESGTNARKCPDYVVDLIEFRLKTEGLI